MNLKKGFLVGALGTCLVAAAAPSASAVSGVVRPAYDAYGAFVYTPVGRVPSAAAAGNSIMWDTNGQYVTVYTHVKDTGRSDGQLAGLYANLTFTDGTRSGRKPVFQTGVETSWMPGSRAFVPSKRVANVQLEACRYSAAAGINACTPAGSSWFYDNPYT